MSKFRRRKALSELKINCGAEGSVRNSSLTKGCEKPFIRFSMAAVRYLQHAHVIHVKTLHFFTQHQYFATTHMVGAAFSTFEPSTDEEKRIFDDMKARAYLISKVHAREVYDSRGNPTVEGFSCFPLSISFSLCGAGD